MSAGKYNMDSLYRKSYSLSLMDLCKEIVLESESDKVTEEGVRKKFRNVRKSGILNHLEDDLNFNFNNIINVRVSYEEEEHNKLKFLKLLYQYEKINKFVITDILSEPRMINIITSYTEHSQYGKYVEELVSKIRVCVPDAEAREVVFRKIYGAWQVLTRTLMDFVISDRAINERDSAVDRLNDIKETLEKYASSLDRAERRTITSTEGVMASFFNYLQAYRIRCFDADAMNQNYDNGLWESNDDYHAAFRTMEKVNLYIPWDMLPLVRNAVMQESYDFQELLLKEKIDVSVKEITDISLKNLKLLILYGKDESSIEKKFLNDAFKYCKTLVKWWRQDESKELQEPLELDYERWDVVVHAIQEIYHVRNNDIPIAIPYRGNKHANKSLLSQLKYEDDADAIVKMVWIQRLKKRCAYNFGVNKQMLIVEDIEKCFYSFKKFILSFYDLKDIELAHDIISNVVICCLENRKCLSNMAEKNEYARLGLEDFIIKE